MTVIVITKDLGTGYMPPERFKASFVKHMAGKINYREVYRLTMRIRKKRQTHSQEDQLLPLVSQQIKLC
jgi:hypothetical protein